MQKVNIILAPIFLATEAFLKSVEKAKSTSERLKEIKEMGESIQSEIFLAKTPKKKKMNKADKRRGFHL